MIIEFNEKDFQITRIKREAKLHNLQTKQPYRVYGLKIKGSPVVHVSYNYDNVPEGFDENIAKLAGFFKHNGLEFKWESGSGTPKVCIGLRRDLRDHVVLSAALLSTIIYGLEDRVALTENYRINGIPAFPNARGIMKVRGAPVVAQED